MKHNIRKWSYIIKKYDRQKVLNVLIISGALYNITIKSRFGKLLSYYKPTNKDFNIDNCNYVRAIYETEHLKEVMVNIRVLKYLFNDFTY